MNIAKGKAISKLYKDGFSVSEIAKKLDMTTSVVESYLKTYYKKIYNEEYKGKNKLLQERYKEIYERYKEEYFPGVYKRTEIAEILKCSVNELEGMLRNYNLSHQRLNTYNHQQSLCNVSDDYKDYITQYAYDHGYRSVRALVVEAVNEFIAIKEIIKEEDKKNENGKN